MTTTETVNATQTTEEAKVETSTTEAAVTATEESKATTTEEVKTEPQVAEKVVPEKYEFTKAEGFLLKDTDLERISAEAKEKGLSQDEAQALVDKEHGSLKSFQDSQFEAHIAKVKGWEQEVINDPVLGGDNFAANAEDTKRAIDRYATPELKTILTGSGFGNHPEFFKMFAKIGKEIADDTLVKGGAHTETKDRLSRMYPSMK